MSVTSRRAFLGLSASATIGAGLALTGCQGITGGAGNGGGGGATTAILPGTVPTGWDPDVLAKVNEKLQADKGFTLNAQFINWSKYGEQALLKFTAGEAFDTALQALWLNMAQLQQSGALANLAGEVSKYPNLAQQLQPQLIKSNTWNDGLWGIPQVNSAARVHHFVVRQDLADKVGVTEIGDYAAYERFLYLIKEKVDGVTPYGVASNSTNVLIIPAPTAQFNAASWEDPHSIPLAFSGKGLFFIPAKDAASTGSSRVVPFWEDAGVVDAMKRVRKYYQDGLINKDALNVDSATITSQFTAGKYASRWAITDGTSSNVLPQLIKAVSGAALGNVAPFADGLQAKPNQTFQADNLVVVNANGGDVDRALQLQDWLSIKENHDLVAYGIEGTHWKAVGDDKWESLTDYAFPGYALCWRSGLERRPTYMTESEESLFDWAQSYDNFTVDPFSSFIPNIEPVKAELAQMTGVITEFANPLYYGVVDVAPQLDKLKKAAEGAGLAKLQEEMERQANAYLNES